MATFLEDLLKYKKISIDCMGMVNKEGSTPGDMLDQALGIPPKVYNCIKSRFDKCKEGERKISVDQDIQINYLSLIHI